MDIELLEANRRGQCDRALKQMEIALAILDLIDGRSDVGAHLDLAICRLRVALTKSDDVSRSPLLQSCAKTT